MGNMTSDSIITTCTWQRKYDCTIKGSNEGNSPKSDKNSRQWTLHILNQKSEQVIIVW